MLLSNYKSAGPVGLMGMLSSSVFECAGPAGTLLPCDNGTILFPMVQADEPSSLETVSVPGERDPVISQRPADRLVENCVNVVHRNVTKTNRWAVLGVRLSVDCGSGKIYLGRLV